MNQLYRELNRKIPFLYAVNDKVYAISINGVFDCSNTSHVGRNYALLMPEYSRLVDKINDNEEVEFRDASRLIFDISREARFNCYEKRELNIPLIDFLESLSEESLVELKNQLDTFLFLFQECKVLQYHPSIDA